MKKILSTLMLLLALASACQAESRQLHIGISTGYPPFYFFAADNRPTGICIDIIERVAAALDINVRYDSYPWKRMLKYGEDGRVDAILPLFKTAEREQFLLFPATGLIDEDNSFFTSADSSLSYSGKLVDMIDRSIAVMDNFSYGKEFDSIPFSAKTIAVNNEQLIKLVQKGRVELGIGNSKVISYAAKNLHMENHIRFLSPPVTVEPLFIGFSKKQVSQDFVDQFNRQLMQLKASPEYAAIIQAYGL